ncbi:MAG: hypothetical protein OWQ54_07380 [Sulfolobaceae archaeon]|nr:hypothetical protein [Sulfolobaceae archaeon]
MQVRLDENSVDKVLSTLKRKVYEYNSKIAAYNVYLKPFHVVYKKNKKYIYIGKYWYQLQKSKGKIKWIYLGKAKPIESLPDPPKIPEFTLIKDDEGYLVDDSLFKEI